MRTTGFTLIEILFILAITAILICIALPNFTGQVQHLRVRTATQNLLESLNLTRTKAVFAQARTTMRKQGNWVDGWDIFLDKNNNGLLDPHEQVIKSYGKLKGVRIVANQPVRHYVSFIGNGEGRNANGTANAGAFLAGTFSVCPEGKGKGYELVLARGGRVRMAKLNPQACASL